jgi:hypothetical protein
MLFGDASFGDLPGNRARQPLSCKTNGRTGDRAAQTENVERNKPPRLCAPNMFRDERGDAARQDSLSGEDEALPAPHFAVREVAGRPFPEVVGDSNGVCAGSATPGIDFLRWRAVAGSPWCVVIPAQAGIQWLALSDQDRSRWIPDKSTRG